jgi:hypothetical protein
MVYFQSKLKKSMATCYSKKHLPASYLFPSTETLIGGFKERLKPCKAKDIILTTDPWLDYDEDLYQTSPKLNV